MPTGRAPRRGTRTDASGWPRGARTTPKLPRRRLARQVPAPANQVEHRQPNEEVRRVGGGHADGPPGRPVAQAEPVALQVVADGVVGDETRRAGGSPRHAAPGAPVAL